MPDTSSGYSVSDLCRRWKVGADKIHTFRRRGELTGINLAINLSGRPQWRFSQEAVEQFELRRSSVPTPKPAKRPKKTNQVDYYAD